MVAGSIKREGHGERGERKQSQKPAAGSTAEVLHEVASKPAPFGEPKPKGMRHPRTSHRVKGAPPAVLGFRVLLALTNLSV